MRYTAHVMCNGIDNISITYGSSGDTKFGWSMNAVTFKYPSNEGLHPFQLEKNHEWYLTLPSV